MAGNANSGNRNAYRGNRPKTYWTERKELEYQDYLRKQTAIKEAARLKREEASRERRRIRSREYKRKKREELKAAGIPCPHGGKEPPKASTARVRRFYERRRILIAAWDAAHKEERRRNRRIAKGLPPTPKSSTQRAKESKERKEAKQREYSTSQWWADELTEQEAKVEIKKVHPEFDEMQTHMEFVRLSALCRGYALNVNRYTIGASDLGSANRARAIFNELSVRMRTIDTIAILKATEATSDLESLVVRGDANDKTWVKNLVIKSLDYGKNFIGTGVVIRNAFKKGGKKSGTANG